MFFAFGGVFAKRKNTYTDTHKSETKNYLYFKYVAQLNEKEFLENIKSDYNLKSTNKQIESDYANQIVVLAKNAERKFKYFNISVGFTIASLTTPLGLLAFHIYNNPNW